MGISLLNPFEVSCVTYNIRIKCNFSVCILYFAIYTFSKGSPKNKLRGVKERMTKQPLIFEKLGVGCNFGHFNNRRLWLSRLFCWVSMSRRLAYRSLNPTYAGISDISIFLRIRRNPTNGRS